MLTSVLGDPRHRAGGDRSPVPSTEGALTPGSRGAAVPV
jgi:hypothetical protein